MELGGAILFRPTRPTGKTPTEGGYCDKSDDHRPGTQSQTPAKLVTSIHNSQSTRAPELQSDCNMYGSRSRRVFCTGSSRSSGFHRPGGQSVHVQHDCETSVAKTRCSRHRTLMNVSWGEFPLQLPRDILGARSILPDEISQSRPGSSVGGHLEIGYVN